MLSLTTEDRVRMLSAVAKKGPAYTGMRIVVITLSLLLLMITA